PGANTAHESPGRVGEARAVAAPDEPEHRNRDEADDRIERLLEAASGDQQIAQEARVHQPDASERGVQNVMTILPKTWRLSSRARPRSNSPRGTSVSITGSMPDAILARLSRMLRMEAPNEPMMRYCCWKSCIRLSVVEGPEVAPQVTSLPPRRRHNSE